MKQYTKLIQQNKEKGCGHTLGYISGSKGKSNTVFTGNCWTCGAVGHSSKNCPTLNKGFPYKCNNCGIVGHKASQCPKQVNEVEDDNKSSNKEPEQETMAISWGGEAYSVEHSNRNEGF